MASDDAGEIASNLQPIGGPKAGFNLSQFGFLASGSDDRRLHMVITKTWAERLSTSWLLGSELRSSYKCRSAEKASTVQHLTPIGVFVSPREKRLSPLQL
jgi:hypothetical protein